MNVKLTSLLDEEQEENETIIRVKNRKFLNLKGSRCKLGSFTKSSMDKGIEVVKLIIGGGGNSGIEPPHQSEEIIICLIGSIEFRIGDKAYKLKKGDSLHFKSNSSSGVFNITKKEAHVLWIFTPPRFLIPEK